MTSESQRPANLVAVLGGWLVAALVLQLVAFAVFGSAHALSDVPHLFDLRGIRPWAPPYFARVVEYPVVIGYTMYLMSFFGGGALGFFLIGAAISGALAVVVAVTLQHRSSPHLGRWIAGAPVLLYVFHNWDLLAIAPAVVGLAFYERDRNVPAGALLGLGAAAKLFPVVFVAPLVAVRLAQRRGHDAVRLVVSGVAVIAAVNLPVLLIAPSRWWWTISFQGARPATWGSLWYYVVRLPGLHGLAPPPVANVLSMAALVCAIALLTLAAGRRHLGAFEIGAAATAIFLLTNKVYSPVYDLWLVPFFAALPIARRWWATFCFADLGVYIVVFGNTRLGIPGDIVRTSLACFVLIRAAAIVAVIATAVRDTHTQQDPLVLVAPTHPSPPAESANERQRRVLVAKRGGRVEVPPEPRGRSTTRSSLSSVTLGPAWMRAFGARVGTRS
jgi:hypothetical protein